MGRTTRQAGLLGTMVVASFVVLAPAAQATHPEWVGDENYGTPDPYWDEFRVNEADGSIVMAFTAQTDPTHVAMWRTESRSAITGRDFVANSGSWPSADASGTQPPAVTVELLDDRLEEGPESFGVILWLDGYTTPPEDGEACKQDQWCDYAHVMIVDDEFVTVPAASGPAGSPLPGSSERDVGTPREQDAATPRAPTGGGNDQVQVPKAGSARRRPLPDRAALEPGPGFELYGDRFRDDAARRPDADDGGVGAPTALIPFALGIPVLALTTGAWRRRQTW